MVLTLCPAWQQQYAPHSRCHIPPPTAIVSNTHLDEGKPKGKHKENEENRGKTIVFTMIQNRLNGPQLLLAGTHPPPSPPRVRFQSFPTPLPKGKVWEPLSLTLGGGLGPLGGGGQGKLFAYPWGGQAKQLFLLHLGGPEKKNGFSLGVRRSGSIQICVRTVRRILVAATVACGKYNTHLSYVHIDISAGSTTVPATLFSSEA